MSDIPHKPLRRGWTTGACAAAAAKAAWAALVSGDFSDPVTIILPGGLATRFDLEAAHLDGDTATVSIIKDAGDDPDVTHRAEIIVTVERMAAGQGVVFAAGEGVGTVTLAGLPTPKGEAAISPGPRGYIISNLVAVTGLTPDVRVTVGVKDGVRLAEKTLNARLGIIGGLSILGTTGVVIPYSCAAWVASIHRGIDVARTAGLTHLAAATGRTSEQAIQSQLGLPDQAMLDMGDFAGAVLKYLRRHPVERLTIAGGVGKLFKLGCGHMDLHSARSRAETTQVEALLRDIAADDQLIAAAQAAPGVAALIPLAQAAGLPLAETIASRARAVALATLSGETQVDVAVYDRAGRLLAYVGG